ALAARHCADVCAGVNGAGFRGAEQMWYWLEVPLWLALGVFAQLLIRFFSCVWVFWTERGWAISHLYYQFYQFATRPDSLYPWFLRYGIMTILPFAFIGSVPARALLSGLSLQEYGLLVGALGGFLWINIFLWRRGLRRYQSASS
ncbi:MAG TPA: ABC-2 family transporter protein, partial [Oligoflexia bacterium]|nr:ABC-2 family transporter protein [Oligoflexia bacterium]